MRTLPWCLACALLVGPAWPASAPTPPAAAASPATTEAEAMLQRIFAESLARGKAHDHLRELVGRHPGRLSGSKALADAIDWAEQTLRTVGVDTVVRQDVMVPHWERGPEESALLWRADDAEPLAVVALGGSVPTEGNGVVAEVIEVRSLDELATLGQSRIAGKIVFFNRPMDPAIVRASEAYRLAVDQRSRGPATAARYGAVAAVVRSMTHALDDHPHTGGTSYPAGAPRIPGAALSTVAAEKLSAALRTGPVRLALKINSRWLPDAPSHNLIAEIRGRELPDEIILVGGHLDSWDIAPGAHDNGSGVVQSIEVLRLFRVLGIQPRRTLRCVLFTNEENGLRGSTAYVNRVKEKKERHLLAIETDNGGFQPRGFNLGSTQGDAHERAAVRWRSLFEPYGIHLFMKGTAGADIGPLLVQGITVAGLLPDSQRYFDYHHTTQDSLDKVNPRELHLGAAALTALVWLADTQGL
jgi:carboxypeptidase Q